MKSSIKSVAVSKAAVITLALLLTTTLIGCSSGKSQDTAPSSQSSQIAETQGKAEGTVFSIDFPAKPEYESTDEAGILSETYSAKSDNAYVLIKVDWVSLDLQGEDPFVFAADITYSFLSNTINTSVTEDDIKTGTLDGLPAGYIGLDAEGGKSAIFCATVLGNDYVLTIFIRADTHETSRAILDSLSVN